MYLGGFMITKIGNSVSKKGIAQIDDGSSPIDQTHYGATYMPDDYSLDSRGRPQLPDQILRWFLKNGAIEGPGWYWFEGPNGAADPILLRQHSIEVNGILHNRLQLLTITRKDLADIYRSDVMALPGGMKDKNEPGISAAFRELLEETGYLADLAAKKQLVYEGVVADERLSINAWPETQVYLMELPETPNPVTFTADSDALTVSWTDVTEENIKRMFASHGKFVMAAISLWQEQNNTIINKYGFIQAKQN